MNRTSTDRGWGQFIQGTVTLAIFLALISTDCQRRTGAEGEARHESGTALAASSMPTSQGSSMTPRMPVPKAAEELTNAFADAATAMRGSVVRVNVEMGATRGVTRGESPDVPGLGDPLERLFRFGPFGSPEEAPPETRRAVGSGFVFDEKGHIMTNAHVVEHVTKVTVQMADDRKLDAKVVGRDPLTDIAVLTVENPPKDLTVARLGNSDNLRVGQWVLAIGSPLVWNRA